MIKVYSQSAFSKDNQGGNLAGIVFDNFELSETDKLKIARIVGHSETVFINKSNNADYKFEYFTPEGEVPICGHATIAAFSLMYDLKMLNASAYKIETGAGILNISVCDGLVYMEQNKPQYGKIISKDVFKNCIDTSLIDDSKPIQIVSTGLWDIILPIKNSKCLHDMAVNFEEMKTITEKYKTIGVHAFAVTEDKDKDAICRNFAPLYGIDEESATGTANCALSCYLNKYGLKKEEYIFEQGYNLNSISKITVKLAYEDNKINLVQVGGFGYTVSSQDICL